MDPLGPHLPDQRTCEVGRFLGLRCQTYAVAVNTDDMKKNPQDTGEVV